MAPIRRLSWELLDLILSYIPKNDDDPSLRSGLNAPPSPSLLPLYATVCKDWKLHFEGRTFKSIRLKSTEINEFFRLFKGNRVNALSRLELEVILPTYSEHACAKFEIKKDQDLNNRVFSDAIHALFKVLRSSQDVHGASDQGQPGKEVGDRVSSHSSAHSVEFHLADVYSLMDASHRGKEKYKQDRVEWELGKRHDLWEHRWEHSFLKLLDAENLPSLSQVAQFSNSFSSRKVEPASIAFLASKFPNVKDIIWQCSDDEKKYPKIQQQLRYDFAQTLQELPLHSLATFNLEYTHTAPANHNFSPISVLHESSPTIDHLSKALNHLSEAPHITKLTLTGPVVVSPAIFSDPSSTSTNLQWPKLRQFNLCFNSRTPNHNWYFTRNPSKTAADDARDSGEEDRLARDPESDTDSDSGASDDSTIWDSYHPVKEGRAQGKIPSRLFRVWPNNEEILPLLKAMARGAKCMPVLDSMTLRAELAQPGAEFEIAFIAKGVPDMFDKDPEQDVKRDRLYWQTGEWRPDEEVLRLWKEKSNELLVRFLDY